MIDEKCLRASKALSPNDNMIDVPLGRGEDVTGRNFVDDFGQTISGAVLEDTDNNDTGDQPIVSVVVELYDKEGNLVNSTATDKNRFF